MSKKPPTSSRKRTPSSQRWQLQTAKAQFSEVFRSARERAPQVVTRQGKEAVVIVAIEECDRLTRRAQSQRVCRSSLLIRRWQDLASILSENPDEFNICGLRTISVYGEISTRLTEKSMRLQDPIRNQRLASGKAPEMLRSYFVGLDWGPRMR